MSARKPKARQAEPASNARTGHLAAPRTPEMPAPTPTLETQNDMLVELFETMKRHLEEGRDYILDGTQPEGGYDPESLLVGAAHLRRAMLTLDDLQGFVGRTMKATVTL